MKNYTNTKSSLLTELTELSNYLNVGIQVMELQSEDTSCTIETISKERFVMLKGSFAGEVSEQLYFSNDLYIPKFSLVRNNKNKIVAVRMHTYTQQQGRTLEIFYDEYYIC